MGIREHKPGVGRRHLNPSVQHHVLTDLFTDIVGCFPCKARAPDRKQFSIPLFNVRRQFGVIYMNQIGADILGFAVGRCLSEVSFGLYPLG